MINRANSIKKALRSALENLPTENSEPRISPGLYLPSKKGIILITFFTNKIYLPALLPPPSPYTFIPDDAFEEKYVMNNYFGLGVDAKIVLEFHKKRDASPKSSRFIFSNILFLNN